MILLLDNYDSFTWNLHHYLVQLTDEEIVVKRNDEITIEAVAAYTSIVLSPGPGLPAEAGIMPQLISKYHQVKPILGICLGLQAIAESFGGKLTNLDSVLHGVEREVEVIKSDDRLFIDVPDKITTGHYHSWIVSPQGLPHDLEVTAKDNNGNIMACSHLIFPCSGVQFHPESVMTEYGMKILENWLHYCKVFNANKNEAVA